MPDGKPAAGVDLYWPQIKFPQPGTMRKVRYVKCSATDEEGRFEIALSASDLPKSGRAPYVIAHKPGFGIDWVEVKREEIPAEIELRLAEDRPIHGRLIDTEGRPIAGANVVVNSVVASRDGSLDPFLIAWEINWRDAWLKVDKHLYAPLGSILVWAR